MILIVVGLLRPGRAAQLEEHQHEGPVGVHQRRLRLLHRLSGTRKVGMEVLTVDTH